MLSVEEPGATSTKVSFDGPKGAKTSHAAAPAASSRRKKAARKTHAAPNPFFFLIVRLRRAIRLLLTLL
jgi:hypothetical protein